MKNLYLFFGFFFLIACASSQKQIEKSQYHHHIAVGLFKTCDKPRALGHVLKAIKFNPRDFLIRYTLAATYYSMNEYKKALVEFKKILRRKSDFTEAQLGLARVYIDLKQADFSLREIQKAEKDMTYPNPLKISSLKGLAYYHKGKYIDAKRALMEAQSFPKGKNCFTYLHLGKVELVLGDLKESEKNLKKALSICQKEKTVCDEPNHEEHLAIAQLYIKKGDKKRAKYHLNLFLQKSKKTSQIRKVKKLLKELS